jgi:hypothetical protein
MQHGISSHAIAHGIHGISSLTKRASQPIGEQVVIFGN